MNALTAAHRKLPLGTLIEVTNLDNDKTVLVRVNDRGPYAHNRISMCLRKPPNSWASSRGAPPGCRSETASPGDSKPAKRTCGRPYPWTNPRTRLPWRPRP
jgi:rare lipoprotein A